MKKFMEFVVESFVPDKYVRNENGESKEFIKSNEPDHRFGFWGLRFNNQSVLNAIGNLKIGETINYPLWTDPKNSRTKGWFKYSITRVK